MNDLLGSILLHHESCVVNIFFITLVCCWTSCHRSIIGQDTTYRKDIIARDNFCNTVSIDYLQKIVPLLSFKLVEDFHDKRAHPTAQRTLAILPLDRRVEDPVDAVVCAYIARYAAMRPDDVTIYGEPATGCIVTPALR